VLGARLDLVLLQVKRSRLASKAKVNTACIAELGSRLASAPDRGVVGAAVAAFRTDIVGVRLVGGVAVVEISVNENLRPQTVALLKVETASVAKRLEGGRISPPEWC
jgi:hypothetical protein